MNYDFNQNNDDYLSTKKLFILFGIAAAGIFIILTFFVFPINNLIREEITEEVIVVSVINNVCVVDTSDHPRQIQDCHYKQGDIVLVKYKDGTEDIIQHNMS